MASVSTMYIAVKIHGRSVDGSDEYSRKPGLLNLFVQLSQNRFSAETIEKMELAILSTLDWKINPPTIAQFISELFELYPSNMPTILRERARKLADISIGCLLYTSDAADELDGVDL
eukprot:477300-Ditylum_brightwellii.AAC.1